MKNCVIVKAYRQAEVSLALKDIFHGEPAIRLIAADITIVRAGREQALSPEKAREVKDELRWLYCPHYGRCLDCFIAYDKFWKQSDRFLCLVCAYYKTFQAWHGAGKGTDVLDGRIREQWGSLKDVKLAERRKRIRFSKIPDYYRLEKSDMGGYGIWHYLKDRTQDTPAGHFLPPGEMALAADLELSNLDHWREILKVNLPFSHTPDNNRIRSESACLLDNLIGG